MNPVEMFWLVAFLSLVAVSLLWKQLMAPWILLGGIVLFGYLVLSVLFDFKFPYRTHNIGIYQVFFLSVILILAGGGGSLARLYRHFMGGG
jgi:hypothetical protein